MPVRIPFPVQSTIDARRSARSYKMDEVGEDVIRSLRDLVKTIPVPFEHQVEIQEGTFGKYHLSAAQGPTTHLPQISHNPRSGNNFAASSR